jgi:hypothetical protein
MIINKCWTNHDKILKLNLKNNNDHISCVKKSNFNNQHTVPLTATKTLFQYLLQQSRKFINMWRNEILLNKIKYFPVLFKVIVFKLYTEGAKKCINLLRKEKPVLKL